MNLNEAPYGTSFIKRYGTKICSKAVDTMCARYEISSFKMQDDKWDAIFEKMEQLYPGQYKTGEIFPGDTAPILIDNNGNVTAAPAVYGYPGFDNSLIINARSETVAEKKTFAKDYRETRAVIPASGFYEWTRDTDKTKYFFNVEDDKAMYMCGICTVFAGKRHFAILTRDANESMVEVHDRMPVIIPENQVRTYLTNLSAADILIHIEGPELRKTH